MSHPRQSKHTQKDSNRKASGVDHPHHRIRGWMLIVGIFAIMIIAALAYYLLVPLDAPIPDGAGSHYQGLAQGFTPEGYPRLGSPDAPVLVEDFSSYTCPHCRDFHEVQFVDLLDDIRAGTVRFVFIPVPDIGWGAKEAAKGALCAGEQGLFWTMHDVLFDWQKRFVTSTFNERRIIKGAQNLGLDVKAFEDCMDSERITALLDRVKQEFTRRGLTGTPTFFINGEKVQSYQEFEDLASRAGDSETSS